MASTYVPRHAIEATEAQPLADPESARRFRAWLTAGAAGRTVEERRVAEAGAWS
ncbi:MAG: hypothetical protein GY719_25775 [bacterium]|nr:hypothetical protein [bacterium]